MHNMKLKILADFSLMF